MSDPAEVSLPFRWDLVTPDQLGSPFSFQRPEVQPPRRRWRARPLTTAETRAARSTLAQLGLSPYDFVRRSRPATFVDVVDQGSTFTELFGLLSDWVEDERAPWDTFKRKLRFVGVTVRCNTSPNTFRSQQHAGWPGCLPAGAVVNVSLDGVVWSYFGNPQTKLTRSFRPNDWPAETPGPDREGKTRQALAEAVALVNYGRSPAGRRALARSIDSEPNLAQPWLRAIVGQLNR